MLSAQVVRESFDPKLITALFKNFSSPYVALFELIDNAVDDRVDGQRLRVSIDYDREDGKLSIKNFNGKGMSVDDLEKFFRWGYSDKDTGRIGRYGQGGKAALGYLAKSFTIKSHPGQSHVGFCVKVKDWENREVGFDEGFEVEAYKSLRDEADVTFEISDLKKEFSTDVISKKVAKTYRPLILQKKVEFIVEQKTIKCESIGYDASTFKRFEIPMDIKGQSFKITGEYGLVPDANSERGGFKVYQFGRNITEKEYFGRIDPSKRWNVERLYGELYIDFDLPLSMNKSEIDIDSRVWLAIKGKMYHELSDIIQKAVDYKTPTKEETNAIRKANKKINRTHQGNDNEVEVDLTNYGPRLLYKAERDKGGKLTIKINREHKAYIKWSESAIGKRLYITMIHALAVAMEKVTNQEAAHILNEYSEALRNKSNELL